MKAGLLLFTLALPAAAAELGGHADPQQQVPERSAHVDERRATLEEMWQRRLLPPDQSAWAPADFALLEKIRAVEPNALAYLGSRTGGTRPWTALPRSGSQPGAARLTREGYRRYIFLLTQDAIAYFEKKGADAKWVFKLLDWSGKPMFNGAGLITEDGARVYQRARRNLEAFWKSPNGDVYGTRRPPAQTP